MLILRKHLNAEMFIQKVGQVIWCERDGCTFIMLAAIEPEFEASSEREL